LIGIVFIQWFLFISILGHQTGTSSVVSSSVVLNDNGSNNNDNNDRTIFTTATTNKLNNVTTKMDADGVAVTVMLKAPKWFHRRYTVMLHNVLANIPSTWSMQIFSNENWIIKDVIPLHPGLQQLREHPRVVWTPLTKELIKQKPKEIMKSTWLWENVIGENVFLFGGNGAICANSHHQIDEFVIYDYVGVPWGRYHGLGGDGSSHSFRHRSAMLRILQNHPPTSEMDSPDYVYFVKYLEKDENAKIADVATTYAFGGVSDPEIAPFVVSGTHASLNWTSRDTLLNVCPELKVIFPSLHEPSCFGAHPNGEKCKATICALQEKLPSSGC
jgi:hypothetical protein